MVVCCAGCPEMEMDYIYDEYGRATGEIHYMCEHKEFYKDGKGKRICTDIEKIAPWCPLREYVEMKLVRTEEEIKKRLDSLDNASVRGCDSDYGGGELMGWKGALEWVLGEDRCPQLNM